MSIGFPLNITLPTSGQVQWDSPLNTVLQALVDAVQAKVTADGINISTALDMQGNYLINVEGLKFSAATNDGTARQMFWKSDGELYVQDGNGHEVQLTVNGSVNVSAGSISGMNGTSATVVYNPASSQYTFTSSPGAYATIEAGDLKVHQGTSANYTDIKTSPNIATPYSLTLPAAPPAVLSLVTIDATGSIASTVNPSVAALTASNATFTNATIANVTVTTALNLSNKTYLSGVLAAAVSGAFDISGSFRNFGSSYVTGALAVVGPATVTGTLIATQTGSFQVLQGVRDILWTIPVTVIVPAATAIANSPAFVDPTSSPPEMALSTATTRCGVFPVVGLRVGDRVDSWKLYLSKGTAAGKVTAQLWRYNGTNGAEVAVGGPTNSTTAIALQTLTSASLDRTVAADEQYYLTITGCGTVGDLATHAAFTVARPTGSV